MNIEIYPRFKEYEILLELYPPELANKYLPEWYKKQKIYSREKVPGVKDAKNCPAIQDFLTTGVVIPSWSDVYLEKRGQKLHWHITVGDSQQFSKETHGLLEFQSDVQMTDMNLNVMNGVGALKLVTPYYFKTPPGYSLQFIDPFYHHRRDVRIMTGISDTDIWHQTNLVFEFMENINISENKDLIIKAGDPLVIVQPFKKEKFKLEVNKFSEEFHKEQENNGTLLHSTGGDWIKYKGDKKSK